MMGGWVEKPWHGESKSTMGAGDGGLTWQETEELYAFFHCRLPGRFRFSEMSTSQLLTLGNGRAV